MHFDDKFKLILLSSLTCLLSLIALFCVIFDPFFIAEDLKIYIGATCLLLLFSSLIIFLIDDGDKSLLPLLFMSVKALFFYPQLVHSAFTSTPLLYSYYSHGALNPSSILFALKILLINIMAESVVIILNGKLRLKILIPKFSWSIQKSYIVTATIILAPFFCFYTYQFLIAVMENGYLSIFTKNESFLAKLLTNLFLFFLTALVVLSAKSKKLYIYILILCICSSIPAFGGQRGYLVTASLATCWLLVRYGVFKIRFIHYIWITTILIFFSIFMQYHRSNESFSFDGVYTKVYGFVFSQGVTGLMIPTYFLTQDNFPSNIRYIVSPLVHGNMHQGSETLAEAKDSYLLNYRSAARWKPDRYILGHGTGGNSLLEMYLAGGFAGVAFFSGLFMLFLYLCSNSFLHWGFLPQFAFLLILPKIFFSPRAHYFPIPRFISGIIEKVLILFERLF